MDLLIWSVNAKQTLEERRRLAKLLPGLLKRLNTGMQMVAADEETRKRFFGKLMRCHTKVMNNAAGANSARGASAATADNAVGSNGAAAVAVVHAAPPTQGQPVEADLPARTEPVATSLHTLDFSEPGAAPIARAPNRPRLPPLSRSTRTPSPPPRRPSSPPSLSRTPSAKARSKSKRSACPTSP